MAGKRQKSGFNIDFWMLHCEKNQGGTRNLVLRGNYLMKTIGKRIRDSDLIEIIFFLRQNQDVVGLDLAYNEITNCGFSNLANFLLERPVIRHLNMIGNNIDSNGIKHLAQSGENLSLYSLRVTGNKLGDEGGKLLSTLIYKNNPLKFLDLSDTHQTAKGLAHIMTALMPSRGGSKIMEYIDIGRPLPQTLHDVHDGHLAELVSQVLQDNKSLKEIHLQQYRFDFRDMEILLEGLHANNTLVCLDLNNNNIGDDGVEFLCKYLKTSPPLECLMIGANDIGDVGALSLSFNLPYSNIKLLDITNNHITDEGMINIFYTIKKETPMKGLFMWGNKLTHKSLKVLQRLFQSKLLDPDSTDVTLYCSDKKLHASWNYGANRYTHRFYCEFDYESISQSIPFNPKPPLMTPDIYYKYHVDGKDIGFPMCEWSFKETSNLFDDSI